MATRVTEEKERLLAVYTETYRPEKFKFIVLL